MKKRHCLGLLLAAAWSGAWASSTVYYNGKVFTAVRGAPLAQAVLVQDGRIAYVGSDAEARAQAGAEADAVDLKGRVLMPGVLDSHSHALMAGVSMISASLDDADVNVPTLLKRLQAARRDGTAIQGDVVHLRGVSSSMWNQRRALYLELNRGDYARIPVVLSGSDGHTGWANQAMLARAGLSADFLRTLDEAERHNFDRDTAGRPLGYAAESAWDRIRGALPELPQDKMLEAGRRAVRYSNSVGITGWLDPAANASEKVSLFDIKPSADDPGLLQLYKALDERGELSARVAAFVVMNGKSPVSDLDVADALKSRVGRSEHLRVNGIKVFADGVLEYPAQTAALLSPYKNSGGHGALLVEASRFNALVSEADKRGYIVHVHAIGDRAVRAGLDGIAAARAQNGGTLPHTITHLQLVDPKDFPRFAQLGVIASMQLLWAQGDSYTRELVQPYVSAQAYRYQYPAHSLLKSGATIAGASDWPVNTCNPWQAMAQAMTRKGPKGVLNAAERMPREEMLYAYTINSARAMGMADEIGSLEVGKRADMILLDRDVTRAAPAQLAQTRVLWTLVGGSKVYSAN